MTTKKEVASEKSRVEAFSDGVFAIAITLLILEVRVPREIEDGHLASALLRMWPSYVAFFTSFGTIGVMWVNHHRLFTMIERVEDGLIGLNLLLLLGITWIPFPTALLAEHLLGGDQRIAAVVYAGSFFIIAIIFNVLWRYAVRKELVVEHTNVASTTRQYALGPVLYAVDLLLGLVNGTLCLLFSAALAIYFALPARLWKRND